MEKMGRITPAATGGGGGGGGGAWTELASETLESDAAAITVTGLDDGYTDLFCVFVGKSDRSGAASDSLLIRMGDGSIASGANDYGYGRHYTGNSNVVGDDNAHTSIVSGLIPGSPTATPEADVFGVVEFTIFKYSDATLQKAVSGWGGMLMPVNDVIYGGRFHGLYRSASAVVDQVSVLPETGTNLKSGSTLEVFAR